MRCAACGNVWPVTADWIHQFEQADAGCPLCRTDCTSEVRPDFCADPDDPVQDDLAVRGWYWYHSSTHESWPDHSFDPIVGMTEETKRRWEAMSGTGAPERWAARQKTKALHVGTYEAAIENMLRRMQDQAGSRDQFYLYRVQLDPDCVVEPGLHREPTNWVGDAHLADVCSPGTTVLRYINVHEDQSGVSLAIEPSAVLAVQRIPIPLTADASDPWIVNANQRLSGAASESLSRRNNVEQRWMRRHTSPRASVAGELEAEIASMFPSFLADRLHVDFDEDEFAADANRYPMKLLGIARLVTDPHAALDALDAQPWRSVRWPTVPASAAT